MKLLKKVVLVGLALAMALSLAACGNDDEVVETEPVVETETETEPETEEPGHDGEARSILTGEWIDEDLAHQRPVAVMLNNVYDSLPHASITKANVVYEINVEGGRTRLMALFDDWQELESIGTVRSTRPYYVYYAYEWQAILAHIGQCVYALDLVNSDYIDNLNGTQGVGRTFIHRMNHKTAPNNAYTSGSELMAGINQMGYDLAMEDGFTGPFYFVGDNETADMSGATPATHIETGLSHSQSYYEYNEEDGLYYRYQFNEPHIDETDRSAQVATRNIIIQNITHGYFFDSAYLDVNVCGTGTGYYITDGVCIPITWSKDSTHVQTHYYTQDGQELHLNQGNTWIHLVPDYRADHMVIQ